MQTYAKYQPTTFDARGLYFTRPNMTRADFRAENVSSLGMNPRSRRLVRPAYTATILDRISALKSNRFTSTGRPLNSEERLALQDQRARFAALLAKLPTPRLP